jgi:hypothetical protein
MSFLEKRGLTEEYGNKVRLYFNYVWSTEMGLDSNKILDEVPTNLKSDIRISRYRNILLNSSLFISEKGSIDE